MPHAPSSYTDFRRAPRWRAKAATHVLASQLVRVELDTRVDSESELLELRCHELQQKIALEEALYKHAYNATRSRPRSRDRK